MEHVAGGQFGLSVGCYFPVGSQQVTVSANNLLGLGIPDNQLLVAILAGVKLIDIDLHARAATRFTECLLTQMSNFTHRMRCVMSGNNVNLIVALVSHPELLVGCQFVFDKCFINRRDDGKFHFFIHLDLSTVY